MLTFYFINSECYIGCTSVEASLFISRISLDFHRGKTDHHRSDWCRKGLCPPYNQQNCSWLFQVLRWHPRLAATLSEQGQSFGMLLANSCQQKYHPFSVTYLCLSLAHWTRNGSNYLLKSTPEDLVWRPWMLKNLLMRIDSNSFEAMTALSGWICFHQGEILRVEPTKNSFLIEFEAFFEQINSLSLFHSLLLRNWNISIVCWKKRVSFVFKRLLSFRVYSRSSHWSYIDDYFKYSRYYQ